MKLLLKLTYVIFSISILLALFNDIPNYFESFLITEETQRNLEIYKTYHVKDITGKVIIPDDDCKVLVQKGKTIKEVDYQSVDEGIELNFLFLEWNEYEIILIKKGA